MKYLFLPDINGWESWGRIFQNPCAFAPLIREILKTENVEIENCTPGTNAVFKVNGDIVKIFAPTQSGFDGEGDYAAEVFGLRWAQQTGVSAPKLYATGIVRDKYIFRYMVMQYIEGAAFEELREALTPKEKTQLGKRLRGITDRLNRSCGDFSRIDVIERSLTEKRWAVYSDTFNEERRAHIKKFEAEKRVYVHGDLNGDNIIITPDGDISIIDFADAVAAPVIYEHSLIISELFKFDKDYLHGFFGDFDPESLADTCFSGLLMHDFGGDIIKYQVAPPHEITDLEALYQKILNKLK